MHISFHQALILTALVGSVLVVLPRGERAVPIIALVASGIEALIAFGLMSLSLARYRIDIILPAILVVAGAICWARAVAKPATTGATVVVMASSIQLLFALGVVSA